MDPWEIINEIEHAWTRDQEVSALWDSTTSTEYLRRRLQAVLRDLPEGKRRNEIQRLISELDDAT